jgi:hypothetical protein
MATKLTKNVKRELLATNRGRVVIAELEPGDTISFRYKGKRTRYEISLHSCYTLAVLNKINEEYATKLERYKAGLSKRKPKPPSFNHFDLRLRMALRGSK